VDLGITSREPSLHVEALQPQLAVPLLEAAVMENGGRVRRLSFSHCALPDAVVARICLALSLGACSAKASGALQAVHFDDCELSELAEEHLLLALEESDGRFMATMNGGTTRSSEIADREAWVVRTSYCEISNETPSASCSEDCSKDDPPNESHSSASSAAVLAADVAEGSNADVQPQRMCKQESDDDEVDTLRAAVADRDERIRELERRLGLQESQAGDAKMANGSNVPHRAASAHENRWNRAPSSPLASPVPPRDNEMASGSTSRPVHEKQPDFSLGDMLAVVGMRLQEDASVSALVHPASEDGTEWLASHEARDASRDQHRSTVHRSRFGFDFDDS